MYLQIELSSLFNEQKVIGCVDQTSALIQYQVIYVIIKPMSKAYLFFLYIKLYLINLTMKNHVSIT